MQLQSAVGCIQMAPVSHRRPSMRERNVRQIILRSILGEAESILTVGEYATAACIGVSLS